MRSAAGSIGAVKFNYGLDDYVGSPRKDDRYSIGGTLIYKLNRRAQVEGGDPPGMAALDRHRRLDYDAQR